MVAIAVTTTAQQLPADYYDLRNEGTVNCRIGNSAADASDSQGMKFAPGDVYTATRRTVWIRSESGTCDCRLLY